MKERNITFDRNKQMLKDIATLRAQVTVDENKVEYLSGEAQVEAKKALESARNSLKKATQEQKDLAAELKKLDDDLARCRGKHIESVGGEWTGTWRSGWKTIKVSSAGGQHLEYTYTGHPPQTEGAYTGSSKCVIDGKRAHCYLYERGKGPTFVFKGEANETLTLSGSTIQAHTTYRKAECAPNENPFCAAARQLQGRSLDATWERVK